MNNFEKIILVLTFCLAVFSAYNIGFLIPASEALEYQLTRYDALNAELTAEIEVLQNLTNN